MTDMSSVWLCPNCGGRMKLLENALTTRILVCTKCGVSMSGLFYASSKICTECGTSYSNDHCPNCESEETEDFYDFEEGE